MRRGHPPLHRVMVGTRWFDRRTSPVPRSFSGRRERPPTPIYTVIVSSRGHAAVIPPSRPPRAIGQGRSGRVVPRGSLSSDECEFDGFYGRQRAVAMCHWSRSPRGALSYGHRAPSTQNPETGRHCAAEAVDAPKGADTCDRSSVTTGPLASPLESGLVGYLAKDRRVLGSVRACCHGRVRHAAHGVRLWRVLAVSWCVDSCHIGLP